MNEQSNPSLLRAIDADKGGPTAQTEAARRRILRHSAAAYSEGHVWDAFAETGLALTIERGVWRRERGQEVAGHLMVAS